MTGVRQGGLEPLETVRVKALGDSKECGGRDGAERRAVLEEAGGVARPGAIGADVVSAGVGVDGHAPGADRTRIGGNDCVEHEEVLEDPGDCGFGGEGNVARVGGEEQLLDVVREDIRGTGDVEVFAGEVLAEGAVGTAGRGVDEVARDVRSGLEADREDVFVVIGVCLSLWVGGGVR